MNLKAYLWVGGLTLLAVACLGIYGSFQSPAFVAGLSAIAGVALWGVIKPIITKRLPADKEEEWRKAERAGRGDEWRRRRLGLPPRG